MVNPDRALPRLPNSQKTQRPKKAQAMKAIKTLGVWIVGIAALVLWHHFLVSSRSPEYDSD
jgi:hypothetical protein